MKLVGVILSFGVAVLGTTFDDMPPAGTQANAAANQGVANIRTWSNMDISDDWMIAGGSRATFWDYDFGGEAYSTYSGTVVGQAGGACKVAQNADNIVCSHSSGNDAYRYVGPTWAQSFRNQLAGDKANCLSTSWLYPCDNVAISPDGQFTWVGWPIALSGSPTSTGQMGFVRMFDCRNKGTSSACNPVQWYNEDGTVNGYNSGRGKEHTSYHGQSIAAIDDPNPPAGSESWVYKHLIISGAPGDNDGTGNAGSYENPGLSDPGIGKLGGYFQVSRSSQDSGPTTNYQGIRPIERVWSPVDHAGNHFGAIVRITPDGDRLVVTAPGQHASGTTNEVGAFYVYYNNGDNTFSLEGGPFYGPTQDEKFGWSLAINDDASRIFVGAPRANSDDGKVYVYAKGDGSTWNLQGDLVDSPAGQAGGCGHSVAWDARTEHVYVGCPFAPDTNAADEGKLLHFDIPLPPTPSPTASPTPTPACAVSADCPNFPSEYCVVTSCLGPTNCLNEDDSVNHTKCEGLFPSGRVPFCHKSGECRDTLDGISCTSTAECDLERQRYLDNSNSVGQVQVALSGESADLGTRGEAAKQMIDYTIGNETGAADLKAYVQATDSVTLDNSLRGERDDSNITDAIEIAYCGEDLVSFCHATISGSSGARRVLQAGEFTVTITYDVDQEIFSQIEENPSLDDPAFEAALAEAAGVDPSNITVTATDGDLVITFVLTAESNTDEPLGTDVLEEIQELESNINSVTLTVINDLNITADAIETTTLDPCNNRDCNGFGAHLCDSETGQCDCPAGYWGINCDEVCVCDNGGVCPENTCLCDYPHYGAKCHLNATFCSDGTCSA